VFSKLEAWLDLLQTARFEDKPKAEWVNSKEVSFGRGQLIGSFRFLQKRWKWGSITKVENFINTLKKKDMIVCEKGQGVTVITICNYDSYNNISDSKRTQKGQGEGRRKDETNKENKVKERNNKKLAVANLTDSQSTEVYNNIKNHFSALYSTEYKTPYYFTPKDGPKIYGLAKKVYFKMKEHNDRSEYTAEEIGATTMLFLDSSLKYADSWLKGNYNLSNIDSKFNEIFSSIKSPQNAAISNKPRSIFADQD
jgi:hypothetical protein